MLFIILFKLIDQSINKIETKIEDLATYIYYNNKQIAKADYYIKIKREITKKYRILNNSKKNARIKIIISLITL